MHKTIVSALLITLTLSACGTVPNTPVWQDMNYRMTSGKIPLLGPSAGIGPN